MGFITPCLITELCRQAGVKIGENEEIFKPIHIIDRHTIARFDSPPRPAHATDDEVDEQAPHDQPEAAHVPEKVPLNGISHELVKPILGRQRPVHERVQDLETKMHRARLNIRAQYHQMEMFMENMNERS